MKIPRELRVGLLAAIALAAFLFGMSYLRGRSVTASTHVYKARFENVDNLAEGSQVKYRGAKVGLVRSVAYDPDQDNLLVEFDVDKNVPIPIDSEVKVHSGLVSLNSPDLLIQPGKSKQMAQSGTTLRGSVDAGLMASVDPVVAKVTALTEKVSRLVGLINGMADSDSTRFGRIARNIEVTSANIAQVTGQLGHTVHVVTATVEDIKNKIDSTIDPEQLQATIASAKALLDSLQGTSYAVELTLEDARGSFSKLDKLMTGLENGEGTLGMLLKDEGVYTAVQTALEDLDKLLVDLREHPKRYIHLSVFGKKERPYDPDAPLDDPPKTGKKKK